MNLMTPTFVGGLLMGLASSLHCAGMCGAVATSLMFTFDRGGRFDRVRALFGGHAGRVTAYIVAGTVLGGFGSAIYSEFDQRAAYLIVRVIGTMTLMWLGISITGIAPGLAPTFRFMHPVASMTDRALHAVNAMGVTGAALSGFAWGCAPCGMVYGALFYAMLSGSMFNGASVMLGFGLGTVPSITAVALGISHLRELARIPSIRVAVGLSIVAFAVISINIPQAAWNMLCQH